MLVRGRERKVWHARCPRGEAISGRAVSRGSFGALRSTPEFDIRALAGSAHALPSALSLSANTGSAITQSFWQPCRRGSFGHLSDGFQAIVIQVESEVEAGFRGENPALVCLT